MKYQLKQLPMKKTITIFSTILMSVLLTINFANAQETIPYSELEEYLPTDISGYTAGDPEGQTMNMEGFSFSSSTVEFYDSEDYFIRISIIDYVAASSMFQAASAMWATGMSYENDEMSAKTIEWNDNISGWEEFNKLDNEATLILGIGDRFLFTIEADGQDGVDFIISIAEDMDLEDLLDL